MNVLFVAPRFHTNQNYLVKDLAYRGVNVNFASYFTFDSGVGENHEYVSPKIIESSSLNKLLEYFIKGDLHIYKKLPAIKDAYIYIDATEPDVAIIKCPKKPKSFIFVILCIAFGIDIIFYTQSDVYGSRPNWKENIEKVVGDVMGFPIFSPRKGDPEKNSKSATNYHYIPFAMEVDEHRKEYFNDGNINILSVGKMTPRKRHQDVVEALNYIGASSSVEIKLKIVGKSKNDKYEKRLKDKISDSKLKDRIKVIKDLKYERMRHQYRNADLFVFPARNEPCGFSHLEAMAHGVPCLVSDGINNGHYVTNEECGFEFETGRPASLARQIKKFLERPSLVPTLGNRAKQVVAEKHDPTKIANKILALQSLQSS